MAAVWSGNASSCKFDFSINWADGTPATSTSIVGGQAGQTIIGSHTYAKPGTYAIVAKAKVSSGSCSVVDGHYRFTYKQA
ncbi:hypothetical protein OHA72_59510 [Dactylosporangium sp. NBC_01737]|uniref:hypothetical protein n=1 Tax=Dactylosporangium sp. NBC_01737 TaxID=2975959 RepID=UPI002E12376C|nr:hypothetical protein OHA72_59510 [Dactylosporangium sp. NBC_01737]